MKTIAMYNLKGGVGKTSSTINIAVLAAAEGKRTLIWDLDPQGSASFFLESVANKKKTARKAIAGDVELSKAIQPTGYEDLWIIPADISAAEADIALSSGSRITKKRLSAQLKSIDSEFDLVLLDCPPGISLLQQNVFNAADHILVPTIPTTLSMRSWDAVLDYFKLNNISEKKLFAFFSMVDKRKSLHTDEIAKHMHDRHFVKSYIPLSAEIEKMGVYQAPLASYAPNSTGAVAYYELYAELKRKGIL